MSGKSVPRFRATNYGDAGLQAISCDAGCSSACFYYCLCPAMPPVIATSPAFHRKAVKRSAFCKISGRITSGNSYSIF